MLALSGCAVPTAVTIASFAADGVSYIATGKSTTDHALSAIAQEDCAMLRALEEKAICAPKRGIPILTAKVDPGNKPPALTDAPEVDVVSPAPPPTAWDFPLVKKEAVSTPDAVASLGLVEKQSPLRPMMTAPVYFVERRRPKTPRRVAPPLAVGPIVLTRCTESTGMQPAAQCGLGPGA